MREDKECPFSGVSSYDRVWRKGGEKRDWECESTFQDGQEGSIRCFGGKERFGDLKFVLSCYLLV